MGWYVFIATLVLFIIVIAYACRNRMDISKLAFVCICFVLFFFMAFRADTVGADTINYVNMFKNITTAKPIGALYSNVNVGRYYSRVENGYVLYNYIIKLFTSMPHIITLVNSLLITSLLYSVIKNQSPDMLLSVWLYITLGIFQTEMNMARNAIAILFCFTGIKYIQERNLIKYLIIVIIATSFHFTSILFLPIYWLYNIKLSVKSISIGFIAITVVSVTSAFLKNFLMIIVPNIYKIYIGTETADFSSYILGIFYFVLIIFVILCLDRKSRVNSISSNNLGSWMAILNLAFFCVGYSFDFGTRVAALFGPYLIVTIPQLINSGIKTTKKKDIVTWLVYLLCGCQYIMRLMVNNIGNTMPYKFY